MFATLSRHNFLGHIFIRTFESIRALTRAVTVQNNKLCIGIISWAIFLSGH